jgi:hypothetical protein
VFASIPMKNLLGFCRAVTDTKRPSPVPMSITTASPVRAMSRSNSSRLSYQMVLPRICLIIYVYLPLGVRIIKPARLLRQVSGYYAEDIISANRVSKINIFRLAELSKCLRAVVNSIIMRPEIV